MFRIIIFWTNGMNWYFRKMTKYIIRLESSDYWMILWINRLISPNCHLNLLTIRPDCVKNRVKIMINRIGFMFRSFMKTTIRSDCTFRHLMKLGIGSVYTFRHLMK